MARHIHHLVAAVIRRGDEVLLVRQQGPDDPDAAWALPGGMVEDGELLSEALAREVREETALEVVQLGPLAYMAQIDNPTAHSWSTGEVPRPGGQAIAYVFEVAAWRGDLDCADPDGFVRDAYFFPIASAIEALAAHPSRVMREPIVAYLRGTVGPGTVWLYRRQPAGVDDVIACLTSP
jgi:8-oxo-dGTP diphosphatase